MEHVTPEMHLDEFQKKLGPLLQVNESYLLIFWSVVNVLGKLWNGMLIWNKYIRA